MANTFQIKRSVGNTAPTGLAQGEPAYVEASGTGDGRLYIGAAGATVEVIGGQYFINLLNSYDVDLPTFAVPANTTITAFGKAFVGSADSAAATAQLDLATITVKGLMPTLSNVATQYLDGTGSFSTPAGGGDVAWNAGVAPADNAIVRFDGTTGQLIQESAIIIDDAENVTGMGTLSCGNITAGDVTGSVLKGNLNVAAGNTNLTVNDTFFMGSDGATVPMLQFDTGDNIQYSRTVDALRFYIGSALEYSFTATQADFQGNSLKVGPIYMGELAAAAADIATFGQLWVKNDITQTLQFTDESGVDAQVITSVDPASATWTWVIDDDTMATASATTVPTSESVKAYIDTSVTGALTYQGGFDPTAGAGAGSPDLDSITSTTGDFYTVTVAGTYNWTTGSAILEVGDALIAESDGVLNNVANWTIVQNNLSAATQTTPGYVSVGAQTFGGTKSFEDISGTDAGATLDSFVIDGGTF